MSFWDRFKGKKNTAGKQIRKFTMDDYDHIPVPDNASNWQADYIATSNDWNDYNSSRMGMWRPNEMGDVQRMIELDKIICRQTSPTSAKVYALEATKLMKKVMYS